MHHHQRCPHCRSVRDAIWEGKPNKFYLRCRVCLCRWNLAGDLLYFATKCPLKTGRQPRLQPATPKTPTIPQAHLWDSI